MIAFRPRIYEAVAPYVPAVTTPPTRSLTPAEGQGGARGRLAATKPAEHPRPRSFAANGIGPASSCNAWSKIIPNWI